MEAHKLAVVKGINEEAQEIDEPEFGDGDGGDGEGVEISPYSLLGILSRLLMFYQYDPLGYVPANYTISMDEKELHIALTVDLIEEGGEWDGE